MSSKKKKLQVNDEGKRQLKEVKDKGSGKDSKAVHTGCSFRSLIVMA